MPGKRSEDNRITGRQFWHAWKNFPEWRDKYWPDTDEMTIESAGWWTKGFIYPFIVTSVAPELHCTLTLERDRVDFIFMKQNEDVAHVEHEDRVNSIFGSGKELAKLISAKTFLKCIISYTEEENVQEHFEKIYKSIKDSGENRNDIEWLLILGTYKGKDKIMGSKDWRARMISPSGTEELSWLHA